MRTPSLKRTKYSSLFVGTLLLTGGAFQLQAADLSLEKVPPLTVEQAPSYPENLARYALGAKIETAAVPASEKLQLSSMSEDHNKAVSALLCEDPTVGYALSAGTSSVVVSLPNIENVESVGFLNHGAQGNVTIATSNAQLPTDSPQWRTVGKQDLGTPSVKTKIGPTEAKYVRLTFDVSQPGRIAGFGLYSTAAVSDFTMPRPRKVNFEEKSNSFALITSNLSDVHERARALYVSSGSEVRSANSMIDDQPATVYTFAGADQTPTAIVDLGKVSSLRRLSAIYSGRKGTVDFYVLNSLPIEAKHEGEQLNAAALQKGAPAGQTPAATAAVDFPEQATISSAALSGLKPVGSVANGEGEGRASVDFPATSGRYVMVRWNASGTPNTEFSVAEIAAFGGARNSSQIIAANDERYSGNYNDSAGDGKTILDNKDIPAEAPAEPPPPGEGPPPSLPQHPPFTFIPQVVPTSP